jgi:hypothetical protein
MIIVLFDLDMIKSVGMQKIQVLEGIFTETKIQCRTYPGHTAPPAA